MSYCLNSILFPKDRGIVNAYLFFTAFIITLSIHYSKSSQIVTVYNSMTGKRPNQTIYDAIIIGSGFGGSMIAYTLVNAGWNVLMLERGDWVKRGEENWAANATVDLTDFYTYETPYHVLAGGNKKYMGIYANVGGPSVFYGGVSFRFRERDFEPDADIITDSGAEWPYKYADLEPYYTKAEQILNIAGVAGVDPTEPFRSGPYPQIPNELSHLSKNLGQAAKDLELKPFRLPLAINYSLNTERNKCVFSTTCDTYACAVEAKNDLATVVLPGLIKKGLHLLPNFVATKIVAENYSITEIECHDKTNGQTQNFKAKQFIFNQAGRGGLQLLHTS